MAKLHLVLILLKKIKNVFYVFEDPDKELLKKRKNFSSREVLKLN